MIKVLGIGGAGGNAVNRMVEAGLLGVDLIAVNTDTQALMANAAEHRIALGMASTGGRGAGGNPDKGAAAAKESLRDVMDLITDDTDLVFISAGMGGGTGSGAAPILAEAIRNRGILTVAVVTTPFNFEGRQKSARALAAIERLALVADALIVVPNQRLLESNRNLSTSKAFLAADDILRSGVQGITDVIQRSG
ncbi:MAG: cell division protein FtsZ, partial [Fimbriimonadaceae bacterium]|nr:cell division protein FtsZ [Fimbriimonadaceae bacterium]